MKFRAGAYCFIFITILLCGCRDREEEQRLTWSTDAPAGIPHRLRLQRFERGNLIRNHSFETGKIYKLDSATTSFAIDGWQQVGRNVEWTDIRNDSVYKPDDAFSGYRAVKISRSKANETDKQGDGILSDFIKVIPGNYSLSLYARLENVMPWRARLGTRMYDAVEVTLQFYDRNKILMNPAYSFPIAGQVINTSFKGLSFANYKTIPTFGWAKITGKSHGFPFPEGDIPSSAHFVRLFIGLKGTGTIWIDSVSFNYSAQNFTVSERMQVYTDTSFQTPELFVPAPKNVTRLEPVTFLQPGMTEDSYPVILVNKDNPDELKAARIIYEAFRSKIKGYGEKFTGMTPVITDRSNRPNASILISVGKTSQYAMYEKTLPLDEIKGRHDGYFVFSPPGQSKVILIGADTHSGLIYAAHTITQMIDPGLPVFHNHRIIDYPDFPGRYIALSGSDTDTGDKDWLTDQLESYKLNGIIRLLETVSTPDRLPIKSSELLKVNTVTGYRPPEHSTLTYNYPLIIQPAFINAKGSLVVPPVFHNEMLDNSDYSEICCQVTVDAQPLYSGSSFFSLNTDAADILRFSSVMGPYPVFLDNSMLIHTEWCHFAGNSKYYPGKLRLFNIFAPYMNQDIREFFDLLDTSMFVVNLPAGSEVDIIRLATAADFMWNSDSYSPDYSLWKVLVSRYGPRIARDLISYADKYAVILEALARIELKIQVARNHKIAQQGVVELTSIMSGIIEGLGNQSRLVRELQKINSGLRTRIGSVQLVERK